MTAEIAILNRTALALAADSAATVSGPRGTKTYDSAEKIFELCRPQPIALMVYNNATFLGVPVDVLARRFRAEIGSQEKFKRLFDVRPRFQQFLLGVPRQDKDEQQFVAITAAHHANRIRGQLARILQEYMSENAFAARRKRLKGPMELITELATERRVAFDAAPLPGFLPDVAVSDIEERHGETIKGAFGDFFPGFEFTDTAWEAVYSLMLSVLRSSRKTAAVTGFVFGGFGEEDLFPKIEGVEVDGIFFGQLRVLEGSRVDIDRGGDTAAIVPFAQKEMVERFIHGLDTGFQTDITEIVNGVITEITQSKKRSFRGDEAEQVRSAAIASLESALNELKKESEERLLNVLDFLSKRELAEMAYSLVELTSRKRRFSSDLDTVGGPIDVAILSKSEGFIWIRRKHFFDKDLNPGYFSRSYRGER